MKIMHFQIIFRCPFGEDDDDFDMNYILDRNVVVGNMLVDELAAQVGFDYLKLTKETFLLQKKVTENAINYCFGPALKG